MGKDPPEQHLGPFGTLSTWRVRGLRFLKGLYGGDLRPIYEAVGFRGLSNAGSKYPHWGEKYLTDSSCLACNPTC